MNWLFPLVVPLGRSCLFDLMAVANAPAHFVCLFTIGGARAVSPNRGKIDNPSGHRSSPPDSGRRVSSTKSSKHDNNNIPLDFSHQLEESMLGLVQSVA